MIRVCAWCDDEYLVAALEKTKTMVEAEGGQCETVMCNVTDQAAVDAMVTAAVARFGSIDLLWNNAGYQGLIVPTLEYPVDDFQRVMDINVVGMFAVLKAVEDAAAASESESTDTNEEADEGKRAQKNQIGQPLQPPPPPPYEI